MSLTEERMLELMAFADGELEPADRERVASSLARDDEARAFLAQLGPLGDTLRCAWEAKLDEVAPDVAGAVMAGIETAPHQVAAPVAVVHSLDAVRAKRRALLPAAIGAIAVAAAGLVAIGSGAFDAARLATPAGLGAATSLQGKGVVIESVDAPSHAVSVFYGQDDDESDGEARAPSSVVIWVDETSSTNGEP